jgi:hypothetical protein
VRRLAEEDVPRVADTVQQWIEVIHATERAGGPADVPRDGVEILGYAPQSHETSVAPH